MRSNKKIFLLYCGTPKSGSSWIYNYLANHPSCEMPIQKELHVLDRIFFPRQFGKWNQLRMDRLKGMNSQLSKTSDKQKIVRLKKGIAQMFQEFSIVYDIDYYSNFFNSLIRGGKKNAILTGDMTPSYAYLEGKELTIIRELMHAADFEIKIVFAMRDPVDRIYSHLRMVERTQMATFSLGSGGKNFEDAKTSFKDFYKHPFLERCTRYETCIKNIESIFPEEQIHYLFFEEFFSTAEVQRLCDFLGIGYETPELETYYNKTEKNIMLDEDIKIDAFNYYLETYSFVGEKFGKDRMKGIWPLLKHG